MDFGNGFYLSNNLLNTENIFGSIKKYTDSENERDLTPVMIEFSFSPREWILSGAAHKYLSNGSLIQMGG